MLLSAADVQAPVVTSYYWRTVAEVVVGSRLLVVLGRDEKKHDLLFVADFVIDLFLYFMFI